MRDLVEAALENHEDPEHDKEAAVDEFGDPQFLLLGYGEFGAEIERRGWDSRYSQLEYSEANTYRAQNVEELPAAATEADYVILAGSTECRSLVETIGETLPEETTSIALPAPVEDKRVHEIDAVDATIPCKQALIQELATDLLTILTAQVQISPPSQLYRELQTAGLVQGFRGQHHDNSEISGHELAADLVTNALANPLYTDDRNHAERCISFLHAGTDLTLGEVETVREEITSQIDSGVGLELFTADTTKMMGNKRRLTLLRI
ncbi:FtsZ family, C-terminal domain [Halopenitus malekzadehii]|uniref:FtsZ family, C-terminal domain n=1 Tax=Halopenitus malekzadehii TaxID=1267564 RepID=A0A1H6ICR3_9EURY|nr:hypothetical protein [Halopenitus malekzadehii]SEH45604.1 FtsZ family, C-terminal domain [Halopenitus malekzadehii]